MSQAARWRRPWHAGACRCSFLEKSLVHRDRIRGEWMPPWGVAEARDLGILDVLIGAEGHYLSRQIPYGDGVAPEEARARAVDLSAVLPGIEGALALGHPRMCAALDDAAQAAGATLLRGVSGVVVTPGTPPRLGFAHNGRQHEVTPRLIVGADGRGSAVARQIGARVETDPTHHLLAGLLVEGVEAWPEEEQSFGVEDDVLFYVFPQGGGRIRLYLGYALEQRRRFSGPEGVRNLLDTFGRLSLPHREALAAARPAGPCHGYPNADTWIDVPTAPGVVLIGDAAGHNDPTIGQGLSISLRDARLVLEALLGDGQWTPATFAHYAEERRERMRRLRFAAHLVAAYRGFTAKARMRRERAQRRMAADPSLALPFAATSKGPFNVPAHAFEQQAWDRILN